MKKFLIACFISLLPFSFSNGNALKNHASPYLAIHGDDPVNWMEWGNAALEKARKENKLLFVSIGYYACHWCHVMHRESYSNAEIAKKLNADFIAVKVDRELNPVLDKRLIDFVNATNGTAGWPLNVFITPEGNPLVGTTYIPRASFSSALSRLSRQWKENGKQLRADAKNLNEQITKAMKQQESKGALQTIADNHKPLVSAIMQMADTLQGGLGTQMKFPAAPQLHALLNLNQRNKNPDIDQFLKLTLDVMVSKGLHDELGGGFYRYTVDQGWNTPHFEKMLYTNALLALLYFDAADYFGNKYYRQIALRTLYFLQEEMQGQNGAFIASLSAVDNHTIEGGYYLWTQAELKKILTQSELKLANTAWQMNRHADHNAGILPMMQISLDETANKLTLSKPVIEQQLKHLRNKLKKYRQQHRQLPRDYKRLTGWNGLVLAAYARGIKYDPKLRPHGQQLSNFLISMWNNKQLRRSANSKKAGTLYDYAASSWGLLKWAKATSDNHSQQMGIRFSQYAWKHFYIGGKWREAEKQLLPEMVNSTHIVDEAYPSPETLLIEASFLSNVPALVDKANQVIRHPSASVESDPYSYASLIAVARKYQK